MHARTSAALAAAVLFVAAAPAHAEGALPASVAMLDVSAVGIEAGHVQIFSELLQAEFRNQLKLEVIGRSDIETMLGLEKMKDMLACEGSSSCMSEIGGALGVDEIVVGSMARMGTYLVVTLKRISPARAVVVAQATRTLKGASEDDLVEAVAPLAAELFGLAVPKAAPPPPPAEVVAPAPARKTEVPAPSKPRPGLGLPVELGLLIGVTSDANKWADGAGLSAEVSVGGRWLEVGYGLTTPLTHVVSARLWLLRDFAELGLIWRYVSFTRRVTEPVGERGMAYGAGAALGVGFDAGLAVVGLRMEVLYARDDRTRESMPITFAAFSRF